MESHTLCVLSGFSCLPTTYEFHGIPHFLCWYRKDTVVCLLFNINYFSLLPVLGLLACPLLPGEIKRCQCASLEGTGWTDGSLFPKLSSSLLVCGFGFFFYLFVWFLNGGISLKMWECFIWFCDWLKAKTRYRLSIWEIHFFRILNTLHRKKIIIQKMWQALSTRPRSGTTFL